MFATLTTYNDLVVNAVLMLYLVGGTILEERKLVKRQRSLEDRRCIFVHITESGQALIQELLPGHVAAIVEEFEFLTVAEQAELGRLCRKLGLREKA